VPDSPILYDNRGAARFKNDDLDGAIADYKRAIELKPDYAQAKSNLEIAQLKKADPARQPDPAVAYYNRGCSRTSLDPEGAIADFTKAIELKTNFAEAFYNRGLVICRRSLVNWQLGYSEAKADLETGIADFDKVIELQPTNYAAYNNRGVAECQKRDWNDEIDDLHKALGLGPDDFTAARIKTNLAIAYYNRGIAKYQKNDRQGSAADVNQAIAVIPNFDIAYVGRGNLKWDKGDQKGAMEDFDKALLINPNLFVLRTNFDRVVKSAGK